MRSYLKFILYLFVSVGFSSSMAGAYEDFFRAIEVDDARTVSGLLSRGFDPNTMDPKGQGGLHLAFRGGSRKASAALLAHPSTAVDLANAAGETALMLAALRGDVDGCKELLAKGAAVNREGWSPLHYAATGPDPKAVQLMLDSGAQVDAVSPNGTTALMMAARYGSESSVNLLLEFRANPRLRNQLELGPVDFARLGGREALTARLEKLIR